MVIRNHSLPARFPGIILEGQRRLAASNGKRQAEARPARQFRLLLGHDQRRSAARLNDAVLSSNGIRNQCSADLVKVWQAKKK
jgi:hypothetical protein